MTPTWTPTQLTQILDLLKVDGAVPKRMAMQNGRWLVFDRLYSQGSMKPEDSELYSLAIIACVEGVLMTKNWRPGYIETVYVNRPPFWAWEMPSKEISDHRIDSRFTAAHLAYCRLHGVEATT